MIAATKFVMKPTEKPSVKLKTPKLLARYTQVATITKIRLMPKAGKFIASKWTFF